MILIFNFTLTPFIPDPIYPRIGEKMEEILELKEYMIKGDYNAAFEIVEELEEMSRKDIKNKIKSFIKILLIHIIKQCAEKRTTRSWERSIHNSLTGIEDVNKRDKSKGYYLKNEEIKEIITDAYNSAVYNAACEAFEGKYETDQLAEIVDEGKIKAKAFELIKKNQQNN